MSEFETGYQALGSYYDDHDDQEGPPTHIIHAVPSNNKGIVLDFLPVKTLTLVRLSENKLICWRTS